MGLFDDIRATAENLAEEHGETIIAGIDQVADAIDDRTGGQHHDAIATGADKARDLVEKLGEPGRG